jgi:cytidylate kinase
MSIITISRGSYSRGKEVAEKVAKKLGYECVAREVLIEASEQFNIPEVKLVRAIHDAPSLFDRFLYGKERYVAYIRSALLTHLQKDNAVYHGLAGHFFLTGVAHVLKVRILADMEDRVRLEMEREKISEREAARLLARDDEERRKWSRDLYGIDPWDSSLYDLVLRIRKVTVDDAVDIICHTVGLEHFRTTPESQQTMDDLTLAAQVQAVLIHHRPDVLVAATRGAIQLRVKAAPNEEAELLRTLEASAKSVAGVTGVKIHVIPMTPFDV